MPDLATILGVQLAENLKAIRDALPGAGYLAQQPPTEPEPTPPAKESSSASRRKHMTLGPIDDKVSEQNAKSVDPNLLDKNERHQLYMQPNPNAQTYLPPEGGDRVVPPEQPLIVKKGGKSYLMMQVPAVNEQGQRVGIVGPKGAPMIFDQARPQDAIVPIPKAAPDDLENTRAPYLDTKQKGMFRNHMRSMYDQMLQQIQAQQGTFI